MSAYNDWWDYLEHSRKGSTWKNHKYIRKIGDVYIYARDKASNVKSAGDEMIDAAKQAQNANRHYRQVSKSAKDADKAYDKAKKDETRTREAIDENVRKRDEASKNVYGKSDFLGMEISSYDANAMRNRRKYDKEAKKSVEKLNKQIPETRELEKSAKAANERKLDKARIRDEAVKKLADKGKEFIGSLFGRR